MTTTYAEALRSIADDAAHAAVVSSASTHTQTEVPCDGGLVRVIFVPAGAIDPQAALDATIARLRGAAGLSTPAGATPKTVDPAADAAPVEAPAPRSRRTRDPA